MQAIQGYYDKAASGFARIATTSQELLKVAQAQPCFWFTVFAVSDVSILHRAGHLGRNLHLTTSAGTGDELV